MKRRAPNTGRERLEPALLGLLASLAGFDSGGDLESHHGQNQTEALDPPFSDQVTVPGNPSSCSLKKKDEEGRLSEPHWQTALANDIAWTT